MRTIPSTIWAFPPIRLSRQIPVVVTVTNVFDDWSTYFTGATDKSDKSAKKTWKFREVSWGSVCNMGAHGGWKYTSAGYTPESNFAWWANVTAAEAGDQSMVFEFDGNKMKTYDASGKPEGRRYFLLHTRKNRKTEYWVN